MKALRDRIGRLHIVALSAAIALTIGLIAVTSVANSHLATTLRGQDARLEAISARAERIQMFAKHIRKVSLTSREPDVDLQFGGFVGAANQLEPGSRLKLARAGNVDQTLEVLSVNKIPQAFDQTTADTPLVELYIVNGRALWAPDAPIVRLLVTATPEKPVATGIIEQHTL